MLNVRRTFARRTLAVLLSCALAFSFAPVAGYAASDPVFPETHFGDLEALPSDDLAASALEESGDSERQSASDLPSEASSREVSSGDLVPATSGDFAPAPPGDLAANASGESGDPVEQDEQSVSDMSDDVSDIPWAPVRLRADRAGTLGDPVHRKILTERSDGTYDLTLTVHGDMQSSQDIAKANVLVVLDASYSMRNRVAGGGTRMSVAKQCIMSLANTLLSQNAGQSEPLIEMSLMRFGTIAASASPWYTDASAFGSMVNGVSYYSGLDGGTNWEDALQKAKLVADAKYVGNSNPTYVIFVSDGLPTFRNTQGLGWYDKYQAAYEAYGVWGTSFSSDALSIGRCYEMSKDDARAIVLAGHEFYGISVFEQVGRVNSLVNYAYTGNDYDTDPTGTQHSYYAADQAALNQALAEIAHNITLHAYYANVTIHDALDLQNVAFASSGPVPYVLKKELSDGTAITYDSATGITTGGTWNFDMPVFGSDGTVSWNPEAGQDALLDSAAYSITFQITPTQQACDTSVENPSAFVPGDNDGNGEDDSAGLPSNVASEAYVSYYTATVSEESGNVTIDQEDPLSTSYNKPVVAPEPAHLTITKHWEGDGQVAATLRPTKLHGTVTRDDGVTYAVELVPTGGDAYSASIDVPAGPVGHSYTFAEEQLPDYYRPSEVTAQASAPSQASWGTLHLIGCAEQNASFSITNSFAAFPLAVRKIESGTDSPLADAQFTLYLDDGDNVFDAASDQLAAVFSDMALTQPVEGSVLSTDATGAATFHGLIVGERYWLVETRAPTGYNLDSMPHAIVVGLGGTMGTYDSANVYAELPKYGGVSTIVIADEPIPDLPLTAGEGIRTLVLTGACLLLAGLTLAGAAGVLIIRKRRGARNGAHARP